MVKTTKIFCRNTCKVRMPLEKNVEYSASAAQALANGYRPCLRCRPDSAPHSYAWQGVNTTVSRALMLLTQRLDSSIESLANSLGITPRYLNKLLQEHIQISAKRYRIYQQVLMAKQLLQQTQLPVEKVAESVGFSNARQLQQHVKTHLRLTPSQLRKNSQNTNASTQARQNMAQVELSESVKVLLAYRPPYNWPQVRDFLSKRAIVGNESVNENGFSKVLTVTLAPSQELALETVAVKVNVEHARDKNGFYLSFNSAHSRHTTVLISMIRRMLDLDANPQVIEKALIETGLLKEELVSGLRIPGVASQFEAGCRAILGQQVSVVAAVKKVNELHAHFSQSKSQEDVGFPLPSEVAKSDLLFLKMPAARRQTIIELATFYVNAKHSQYVDSVEDYSVLINTKGIGPWTVNYIALRAVGETDIWLDTDLVVKQQVTKFVERKQVLTPALAAPWRSYLTLNLWSLA